jgi:hypothetical protein
VTYNTSCYYTHLVTIYEDDILPSFNFLCLQYMLVNFYRCISYMQPDLRGVIIDGQWLSYKSLPPFLPPLPPSLSLLPPFPPATRPHLPPPVSIPRCASPYSVFISLLCLFPSPVSFTTLSFSLVYLPLPYLPLCLSPHPTSLSLLPLSLSSLFLCPASLPSLPLSLLSLFSSLPCLSPSDASLHPLPLCLPPCLPF